MARRPKVALIGGETLLGREVRNIAEITEPKLDLRLVADGSEHAGALTSVGDEPTVIGALDAAQLDGMDAVIFAGSEESTRKATEILERHPGPAVIDLTSAVEDAPDARVCAPCVEAGVSVSSSVHVVAHPAAIALAMFLRRLQQSDPIRRAVIEILVPASEFGKPGVEELQQQTVSLLSFKSLPKSVFDAQAAFCLLARYGSEARVSLEETELRIERHLATLLARPGEGEGAPMPSLRAIQAPVFHGYSFSAWVEFESNPGVDALESWLATNLIEVRGPDVEAPDNVGSASQEGIAVGAIVEDRNNPDACWFWIVADNFRLAAENAVAVARELA